MNPHLLSDSLWNPTSSHKNRIHNFDVFSEVAQEPLLMKSFSHPRSVLLVCIVKKNCVLVTGTYLHNHRRERCSRLDGGPHQKPPII